MHDVLVGCTSIYKTGANSQSKVPVKTLSTVLIDLIITKERATVAPAIRQLFSSSPRDPRYHMLSYISHKFSEEIRPNKHEPRAALFLNRFSRTSTIMYATNGLANVLGITADQLNGKSFYYCIQENCLEDAVKCLESAKANDSIAYLRFWFRDPREAEQTDGDQHMDGNSSGDDDDGGVHLDDRMDEDGSENAVTSDSSVSQMSSAVDQNSTGRSSVERDPQRLAANHSLLDINSRSSSGNSTDLQDGANDAIFDQPATRQSSSSSLSFSTPNDTNRAPATRLPPRPGQIELEAVISCTSDGLVVVLRRARALVPQIAGALTQHSYANGCFASPWATDPIMPNLDLRQNAQLNRYQPALVPLAPTGAQADTASMKGPDQEDFMNSIREVAVFAWSLTGINGSLARYGRGRPTGQSLPPGGLPIWKPDFKSSAEIERHPHHGNNPQETRQYQAASKMHMSSHTSDTSNIHSDRFSDYIKNSQDTTSNGQGYGRDSKSTPPSEWTNEKGNGSQDHMESNYLKGIHNRSNQPYGYGSQPIDPSNTQTQYNDWYQQGLDSGYSNDYQHYSLNGHNHESHHMADDQAPIASDESRSEPSYRGLRGPISQNRTQYHDSSAMDSTNAQSYLSDRPSNGGYPNGNGTHHRGHHNWLSQQH